jgi:hypothetical protein
LGPDGPNGVLTEGVGYKPGKNVSTNLCEGTLNIPVVGKGCPIPIEFMPFICMLIPGRLMFML